MNYPIIVLPHLGKQFFLYTYTHTSFFFNLMHPHIEISLELSLVILSLHKENHLLEIPDPYLSKSGFGK